MFSTTVFFCLRHRAHTSSKTSQGATQSFRSRYNNHNMGMNKIWQMSCILWITGFKAGAIPMADHREGGKQGVLKKLSIHLCAFTEKERKTTDR